MSLADDSSSLVRGLGSADMGTSVLLCLLHSALLLPPHSVPLLLPLPLCCCTATLKAPPTLSTQLQAHPPGSTAPPTGMAACLSASHGEHRAPAS